MVIPYYTKIVVLPSIIRKGDSQKGREKKLYNIRIFYISESLNLLQFIMKYPSFLSSFVLDVLNNWISLKTEGLDWYLGFRYFFLRSLYNGHFRIKWNSSSMSDRLHIKHNLWFLSTLIYVPFSIESLWAEHLILHIAVFTLQVKDLVK